MNCRIKIPVYVLGKLWKIIDLTDIPNAMLAKDPKIMYMKTAKEAINTNILVKICGFLSEPLIGKIYPIPSKLKQAIPKNSGKFDQFWYTALCLGPI